MVSTYHPAQVLERVHRVAKKTPLEKNEMLSEKYEAEIYFKREDLQTTRSYKLRGAYNKISQLSEDEKSRGLVCASAGNHAQGVAYSCRKLKAKAWIFMPKTTPLQKIDQVKFHGKEFVEIILTGISFDDAYQAAQVFSDEQKSIFIPPFDDRDIIEGQSTIGHEILDELSNPDFIIMPVGGGGLAAGISLALSERKCSAKLIGAEPQGAPSMTEALKHGFPKALDHIDPFVDGAAVKKVGTLNFSICRDRLNKMLLVEEGKICTTILEIYNREGIVLEPAAALSVTALDQIKAEIKGKKVVCLLSGSNNDITRMEEIKERSMLYEGLKHYFMIRFPQRAGALRDFLSGVLGPNDDISFFQYSKKNNRESGPAVVGIEINHSSEKEDLLNRMKKSGIPFDYLNSNSDLMQILI